MENVQSQLQKEERAGVPQSSTQVRPAASVEEEHDLIRLISFQLCNCLQFDSSEEHYVVSISHAKIKETQAVAISYTWGEFDRKYFQIGHLKGSQTRVTLNLGAEWSVHHFLETLRDLSTERGCWIDQICIPQKDDEIRKTLAAIPTIYMTLPVIIILPGPMCNCLRNAFDTWEKALISLLDTQTAKETEDRTSILANLEKRVLQTSESNLREAEAALDTAKGRLLLATFADWCLISNGCCSWSDRVWTFQELRYATSVTIRFADKKIIDCVTRSTLDKDKFDMLGGYIGCAYREARTKGMNHDEIMEKIARMNRTFCKRVSSHRNAHFQDSNLVRSIYGEDIVTPIFAKRLLGETASLEAFNPLLPTHRLHFGCETLRSSKLLATQPKDYILSVWPGSVFYEIPENVEALTPFELLADSLQQMRHEAPGIWEFYCPTAWPAGLFGATTRTAHWDPKLYIPTYEIKDSRDVYGAFRWTKTVDCNLAADIDEHTVPLRIREQSAEGSTLFNYADMAPEGTNEEKIRFFNRMLRFVEEREEYLYEHSDEDLPPFLPRDADPETALYDFVCKTLYLAPDSCRQHGIELMFTMQVLEEPLDPGERFGFDEACPCIGLINSARLQDVKKQNKPTRTLTLYDKEQPFYQIVQSGEQEDTFAVIGVWLPLSVMTKCVGIEATFADVEEDGYNALLI